MFRDSGRKKGAFSASDNGLLVYQSGSPKSGIDLTWLDRSGHRLQTVVAGQALGDPSVSPGGKDVVASIVDPATEIHQLVRFSASPGPGVRLTFGPASNGFPIWSPDGTRIAFSSDRGGGSLCAKPASGAGEEEVLFKTPGEAYPTDLSRDGRFLVYSLFAPGEKTNALWILPLFGDLKPFLFARQGLKEPKARFSPDGKWIAYDSYESGVAEVYVTSFPDQKGKWQISQGGGTEPRWRGDGNEIYFLNSRNAVMASDVTTAGSFQAGTPHELFQIPVFYSNNEWAYDVSPDGQRFLVVLPPARQTATFPITLVTNWAAGLMR